MTIIQQTADHAWLVVLQQILSKGEPLSPRGQPTQEILHNSAAFDMQHPVVLNPQRKLSYVFMAAEALWILRGSDRCDEIVPYNKNIASFSDNGRTFQGAYGPPISSQLGYIVQQLNHDPATRQAVLTIWQPNPRPSKDIPCTVALTFNIRNNRLNCHAFMRSSDAWLGWPYDVFNFTMIAALVICRLKANTLRLGTLFWTGVSSHLYEQHVEQAQQCLGVNLLPQYLPLPQEITQNEDALLSLLKAIRDKQDATTWSPRHAPQP